MKTYEFQEHLPLLPIPKLEDTRSKLLDAIEPLVSEAAFKETKKVVQQFFNESGEAQKFQECLETLRKNTKGSWLKPFWDDVYLTSRGALHTSSNFNILLDNVPSRTIAELAGKVSRSVAEFYHTIIDRTAAPEMVRGIPIDMSQYPNFFRSVRIPQMHRDEHYIAEPSKVDNHISLMTNGHVTRFL